MAVVITGTPGAGKSTVGRELALLLGYGLLDLDGILEKEGVLRFDDERNVPVIDLEVARRRIAGMSGRRIVVTTLHPDAADRLEPEAVVILRCDPLILRYRLESRGYPRRKIVENLEAEIIGYLTSLSVETFGANRILEVETSRGSPREVAAEIARRVNSGGVWGPSISWLHREGLAVRLRSALARGDCRTPELPS